MPVGIKENITCFNKGKKYMHKDRINWLDINELAEYLHLGKSTIERFIVDGKFPSADYLCILVKLTTNWH